MWPSKPVTLSFAQKASKRVVSKRAAGEPVPAFRTELAGEGVEGSGVLSFHLRGPRKGMRAFGEVIKNYCNTRKGPRHGLQFNLIISLALKIRDLLSPEERGPPELSLPPSLALPVHTSQWWQAAVESTL